MSVIENKHGKFFGPVQIYMGYVFIACGLLFISYSPATMLFLIPGAFMAFTSTGTIIDTGNKRLRPYTNLFGFIRTGKWVEASEFCRFKIVKSNRRYTSYSRANMQLDMNITDLSLLLVDKSGRKKVVLNRFSNFEDARKEMDELSGVLLRENPDFQ